MILADNYHNLDINCIDSTRYFKEEKLIAINYKDKKELFTCSGGTFYISANKVEYGKFVKELENGIVNKTQN